MSSLISDFYFCLFLQKMENLSILYPTFHLMKKPLKSQLSLPLSWKYSEAKCYTEFIELNNSTKWIYSASLLNMDQFFRSEFLLNNDSRNEIIIRGCNQKITDYLLYLNFRSILIGKEAILELDKELFTKRSLKEQIRRGLKHGCAEEVEYSTEAIKQLADFKNRSSHASEPQLKYFFIDEFKPGTRLFVFKDTSEIWQAAVLVSKNSTWKIHTELLLRKKNTPNGVMEALLYQIYLTLREDGFLEWSLGEVPFIKDNHFEFSFFSLQGLLIGIGRSLKFAYNYKGLFFFKNKLASRWDNIYMCASPKVKLKHFILLSIKSNLTSLALFKLFK